MSFNKIAIIVVVGFLFVLFNSRVLPYFEKKSEFKEEQRKIHSYYTDKKVQERKADAEVRRMLSGR